MKKNELINNNIIKSNNIITEKEVALLYKQANY